MKNLIHQGHAVERIIHSKGYSITEFAKLTNVNRSFVYNWLDQSTLKPKIIQTISKAIGYDFHTEFTALASEA